MHAAFLFQLPDGEQVSLLGSFWRRFSHFCTFVGDVPAWNGPEHDDAREGRAVPQGERRVLEKSGSGRSYQAVTAS